jgi:hypothetical protein
VIIPHLQALIFMPNIWNPWKEGDSAMLASVDERVAATMNGDKTATWALVNTARAFCNCLFSRKTGVDELGILIITRMQWAMSCRSEVGKHRIAYREAGEGSPFHFNNIALTEMTLLTLASLSPSQLVDYLHEQNIPSDWVPWDSAELAAYAENKDKQYSPA